MSARAARLALRAACRSTGMSSASAPTLFIRADKIAPSPDSSKMCDVSLCAVAVTALARVSNRSGVG